jgi:hypothetical protein
MCPVLQVVAPPKREFEGSARKNKESCIHFTKLRVCDGSKDVILVRLSMHLASDGKKLVEGDIIQLNLFTPLTYAVSGGGDSPYRSPAVVVHTYTKVGYAAIPNDLHAPRHCVTMSKQEIEEYKRMELQGGEAYDGDEHGGGDDDLYEELEEVECTPQNRYCSRYGLSQVLCVCESNPVGKIDLETVREFCYFATTDVSSMSYSWRRNMLYWWYMTNIYNICGKDNREEPPKCLLAAIRNKWPEANGKYKKYIPKSKGCGKKK